MGHESHAGGCPACVNVLGEQPPSPLILPRRALRRLVVGARAGEVAEVPAPADAPWMRRTGLRSQLFEFVPSFEVVWIITEWNLAPTVRVRLKRPLPPVPARPGASQAELSAWARAIESGPAPEEEKAVELWASYLESAAEVRAA